MTSLRIRNLPLDRNLDRRAMAAVRGGGAPWVFGWIRPFIPFAPQAEAGITFIQINNFAEQMINQYQMVNVSNSAAGSTVSVAVDERSANTRAGILTA